MCWTMVRKGSEELNHTKLIRSYPMMILAPSETPNTCNTILYTRIHPSNASSLSNQPCRSTFSYTSVVQGCSVQWNIPELTRNCPSGLFLLQHSGSRRFGVVEPLQTNSNLPCRPASPFVTVVRGGSVGLTYRHQPDTLCDGMYVCLVDACMSIEGAICTYKCV